MTDEFQAAQAKVEQITNPESVAFFEFLEDGGIVLPHEEVTFYLNRQAGYELAKLRMEYEGAFDKSKGEAAKRYVDAMRAYEQAVVQRDLDQYSGSIAADEVEDIPQPDPAEFEAAAKAALKPLQERIDAKQAELENSGMVFHLKGVRPDRQIEVQNKADAEAEVEIEAKSAGLKSDQLAELIETERAKARTAHILSAAIEKVEIRSNGKVLLKPSPAEANHLVDVAGFEEDVEQLFSVVAVLNTAAVLADPKGDAGFRGQPPVPA